MGRHSHLHCRRRDNLRSENTRLILPMTNDQIQAAHDPDFNRKTAPGPNTLATYASTNENSEVDTTDDKKFIEELMKTASLRNLGFPKMF